MEKVNQEIIDIRTYRYEDEQGKLRHQKVKYSIMMKKNKVVSVINEYSNTIDNRSECFQHYSKLFNK